MESSPDRSPCTPVKPVAPYLGGKRHLAGRVIDLMGLIPHSTYVEPFIGMGGVFLRRPFRTRCEVINDISGDVATLFRVLQRHYVAFMDMLRWQITSRAEFERLLAANAESLTDLERAARFLYVQRLSFGGKVAGRSFGTAVDRPGRFDISRLAPALEDVHDRLSGVIIERLPYAELLPLYDRPGTLTYLDPPYYGCEGDYGAGVFAAADFERLAELLGRLRGRFILSLNDHPEVRRIFAGFPMERVETTYTISREADARGKVGELLIGAVCGTTGTLFDR